MDETANIALIRRWFDEVWDKGREQAIDEMYAADGKAWGIGATFVEGPEAFKQFHRLFCATLSDIRVEIHDLIDAGDRVAMRCTFHMTHNASGKQIVMRGGGIGHVKDGKITEAWNAFDFLGVLTQLGALSEDAFVKVLQGSEEP
jgi:predicted ester cyclase